MARLEIQMDHEMDPEMDQKMDYILVLSGLHFFILGLWWCAQASKRYHFSKLQHLGYQSSVTFPCCHSCQRVPIEGIVRFLFSIILIVLAVGASNVISTSTEKIQYKHLHIATIFAFFAVSAIIDTLHSLGKKSVISDLDYMILSMSFGIQGILHGFHVPDHTAQEWTIYNLLMIASFICCIAVALELRARSQVFCTLLRGMGVTTLGSWYIHSAMLLQDPISLDDVDSHPRVMILSMYFSWHCAINFAIVACIWLLVHKCYRQSYCPCVPLLPYNTEPEGIYLENRVRFDYPSIDHLDSGLD